MRSEFETVTVERRDNHILLVTLNRPDAANALNTRMGLDLVELFEHFTIARRLSRSTEKCSNNSTRSSPIWVFSALAASGRFSVTSRM